MNIDGKEQGYKFSRLWLNRYLANINKWDKQEMEKRFELIAARFYKFGPFPDVVIDESFQNEEINIFDADDPTNRKLDYAIFFNQKLEITCIIKFVRPFNEIFIRD